MFVQYYGEVARSYDDVIARVGDELTQVNIQGQYAPPLGGFGRLIYQAFLHRVAEATTKDLVDRVVEELGSGSP